MGALAFYLSKYKGLTFVEMVKRANEIAAISVCGPGTQTSYPTVEKLPPALFDPPGVNSCPRRAPRAETISGHQRSKSEDRARRVSFPNGGLSSSARDGKPRNPTDVVSKGQPRRASNDETLQSNTKKTRGFFARRKSEGCVNTRKRTAEQNAKVDEVDNRGGEEGAQEQPESQGRRGSVPQVQGVSLELVENVSRETMIDS